VCSSDLYEIDQYSRAQLPNIGLEESRFRKIPAIRKRRFRVEVDAGNNRHANPAQTFACPAAP